MPLVPNVSERHLVPLPAGSAAVDDADLSEEPARQTTARPPLPLQLPPAPSALELSRGMGATPSGLVRGTGETPSTRAGMGATPSVRALVGVALSGQHRIDRGLYRTPSRPLPPMRDVPTSPLPALARFDDKH